MNESKVVVTGQFEGSKKHFRNKPEKKDEKIINFIKKVIKRTRKIK